MCRSNFRFFLFAAALSICVTFNIHAQLTDPEAEYSRIRTTAINGNYSEAAIAARKLLKEYPEYGDARILLGRILAWDKKYTEAAAVLDTLLMKEPQNKDAKSARLDVAFWSGDNNLAGKIAGEMIRSDSSDTGAREKLIKILLSEGKREQALAQSDTLLQLDPHNSFASLLKEPLPDIKKSDNITAGYSFDSYNKPYSRLWQQYSVSSTTRFNWGMAGIGVNIGHLVLGSPASLSATEPQFVVEASPVISKSNYAYLSYAFSPGDYFPRHRATFEVWQTLPSAWAVSVGLIYFHFDRDLFISDLSVEKYLGNYWFSGKTYIYFKDFGITTSYYLTARRYLNDLDFIQMTLGAGTAPDEPFDIQNKTQRLSSYSLRASYYNVLSRNFALRLNAGYSREEYSDNDFRNRFEGGVGLVFLLNTKR